MNKQQAQQELDQLKKREAELMEILNKPERTPEQFFLEVMSSVNRIVFDKKEYPDSTFFFSGEKLILEIEKSNTWLRYAEFWYVFQSEFSMEFNEIQYFIKNQLEKHFKIKDVTAGFPARHHSILLEKHFDTLREF
jgi:hypothetical protein